MKKLVVLIVTLAVLAGFLTSCSEHLCPAYSYNNDAEQIENLN